MRSNGFIEKVMCYVCLFLSFNLVGCMAQKLTSPSEIESAALIEMPIPSPVVPSDWPKTFSDKSGNPIELDSEKLYRAIYVDGWNDRIHEYAEDPSDLVPGFGVSFRQESACEMEAGLAGNSDCKLALQKLERIHGVIPLQNYLRKNLDLYR